ncbi:hypothetical protein ACFXKC_55940 [Streptomyces sp. NPDC059340]|uniref:ATP-dependent DNA ligase n=1 Tax=Streptomyces sp. NPDC059340 TaxID=3346806 RepID=UPI0036B27A96
MLADAYDLTGPERGTLLDAAMTRRPQNDHVADRRRVRLQARSGRDVTAAWGDLALAGHHLPAGTVLDGEAVIITEDGRISFEAAQARAASSPTRAHRLAAQRPAHYVAFDALQLPSPNGGIRARSYSERRTALLSLLACLPANTPIQAVSATTDRDTALPWYDILHSQGCLRTTALSCKERGG